MHTQQHRKADCQTREPPSSSQEQAEENPNELFRCVDCHVCYLVVSADLMFLISPLTESDSCPHVAQWVASPRFLVSRGRARTPAKLFGLTVLIVILLLSPQCGRFYLETMLTCYAAEFDGEDNNNDFNS